MMEMDGRGSAKCRKSKLGDIDGIIGFVLNDNNAKIVNSIISYKLKRSQNVKKKIGEMQKVRNCDFRESKALLSRFAGDPTVGIRRDKKKAVLRGDGNA